MSNTLKKLPIGYSSLREIVKYNAVYVDKTVMLQRLIAEGKYYFLSRPRRFGKSLTVDTLKQLFLGNKQCFSETDALLNWDWSQCFPVIHMSFGVSNAFESAEALLDNIRQMLQRYAELYQVILPEVSYGVQFDYLIKQIAKEHKEQVVLLIDEYDKPILDVITDVQKANLNREILKGLYNVIKDNDEYLRFVFVTGVTKFSKVSLFSGLNNLEDVSLVPQYADICGYTQLELDHYFKAYLEDVDEELLKKWYNGYSFAGEARQKVYSPYDVLLFIRNHKKFANYWFQTGTPAFLIHLLKHNRYNFPLFEHYDVPADSIDSIDVKNTPLEALLFQAGYLTIKKEITIGTQLGYTLTYPNLEVKAALSACVSLMGTESYLNTQNRNQLNQSLISDDWKHFQDCLQALYAAIPNQWYLNNPIQNYEGHYCTVIYSYLTALGYDVETEASTANGRLDMSVIVPGNKVIIFEFKVADKHNLAKEALQQIISKNYKAKFLHLGLPIYEIGISFDKHTRMINGLELGHC